MPIPDPTHPARDPVRWSPVGVAFVVLGLILIAWAASSALDLVPYPDSGPAWAVGWPVGIALAGGIFFLFGLLLAMSDPRGFRRPRRQ